MAASNQRVADVVKLYVLCFCHAHEAEKKSEDDRVTKLQIYWLVNRFQQTGKVDDCLHNNINNFKKRLDVFKRKMDITLQIWCKS